MVRRERNGKPRKTIQHYWEDKAWGRVIHPLSSRSIGISCLEVTKGHQSSRHYHVEKANSFVVVSGSLLIIEWNKQNVPTSRVLTSGQSYTVRAGVDHRFCVLKSGVVVEYYSVTNGGHVRQDDICRVDVSGVTQGEPDLCK